MNKNLQSQLDLFGYEQDEDNKKDKLSSLDEMFSSSRCYRNSFEYMNLMRFIGRFRKYSPYNCMLLYLQNPTVSYVATAKHWREAFERYTKDEARPMIILAPMTPVLFVYDLKDTEGRALPEELLRPFVTKGQLPSVKYDQTIANMWWHDIIVRETMLAHQHAGSAMKLDDKSRRKYELLDLPATSRYLILINKGYTLEDKYSSLAHELAHIFCGHCGADRHKDWWGQRNKLDCNSAEIEAESTAFLVCERLGLSASSAHYLVSYQTGNIQDMPVFSINSIFNAVSYIEDLSKGFWKEAKKKPKKQLSGKW